MPRQRLGIDRARLRAHPDEPAREQPEDHRAVDSSRSSRVPATRMVGTRAGSHLRHARLPGRGGDRDIGDWVMDDEPVTLTTTSNRVVALPYNSNSTTRADVSVRVGRCVPPGDGLVRVSVPRKRRAAQGHGDCLPRIPLRLAPSHPPRRAHPRDDRGPQGVVVWNGR